jgi:uncharacterized protein (DUF1330 family)
MSLYLDLGLTMLAGAALGAAGVSALYARAKAPVYLVTEIDVSNAEAYSKEFAPKAQASIKAAGGGKIVALGGSGGVGAKAIVALEGAAPKRADIQQWESMDALNKWYNGADMQAALKIGRQYATIRRYAIVTNQ